MFSVRSRCLARMHMHLKPVGKLAERHVL
jgi:hypothetical protein